MSSKRQLTEKWEQYVKNLKKETPVPFESSGTKQTRIKKLEADPELWFKYHFSQYAYAEPAEFHKKATKRIIKNKKWYEVRANSRELAKSTRAMMEVFYLAFVKKEIVNILLISNTFDNAVDLLTPFKLNLEFNQRFINDYGIQKSIGNWEDGDLITKSGIGFRAIGGGQSPRGTRNEHARPDFILIDDFDTDVICRNPERLQKRWEWIEQALIPTVSVSGKFRFLFLGNIIAKDCCIKRAIEKSDYHEIINIRDENGKSTWSEKNSEEDIDYILSKISYASQQKEYFNNPISTGTVFKDLVFRKIPALNKMSVIIRYGDPSPSNAESKKGSRKAVVEVGEQNGIYYIIRVRLDNATNHKLINWYHELEDSIKGSSVVYNYMENNSLQNPFYQQVYKPLMEQVNKELGNSLYVLSDERSKPDKFFRIEGTLEPLHRFDKLIFNIDEKDNPHMKRLIEEFEAVNPKLSAPVDGVDAVEGGVWMLQNKLKEYAPIKIGKPKRSKSKHF